MKSLEEINKIAESEADDEDTVSDIADEGFSRGSLWRSAFKFGYQMGQAGVDKYEDMP